MSANKIEGRPDGWKLVRIGSAYSGESALGPQGDIIFCKVPCWASKNYVIIEKIEPPKPTYVPWTYETCPIGCVVRRKNGLENVSMVVAKTDISAGQAGCYYLYSQLFEHWEQLDGTPCGTVEVSND